LIRREALAVALEDDNFEIAAGRRGQSRQKPYPARIAKAVQDEAHCADMRVLDPRRSGLLRSCAVSTAARTRRRP
jgi:hypothetical protein